MFFRDWRIRVESGVLDLVTANLWASLVFGPKNPDMQADRFDQVSYLEVQGAGYRAGGQRLGARRLTRSQRQIRVDVEDLVFRSVHVEANGVIVYIRTDSLAGSTPLAVCPLDHTVRRAGNDLRVSWTKEGFNSWDLRT